MRIHNSDDIIAIRAGQRGTLQKILIDYPPALCYSILACILGAFGFGYQASVMNITWRVHDRWLDEWYWTFVDKEETPTTLWYLKEWLLGSFYSTFAIGAIIGSYCASRFSHSEGVKKAIHSSAIPATFAYSFICITCLLNWLSFLYSGRFLIGIYCGFQSVLIPCYVLEITHREIRTKCFAICQVGYCLGVLMAAILGHQSLLGRQDNLDLYMSISVVAYAGQWWLMSTFGPHGPRDLYIRQSKIQEAREVYEKLIVPQDQIEAYLDQCEEEKKYIWESRCQIGVASKYDEVLISPGLQKQVRLSIWLQLIFQLCSITLFIASCSKILETRKFDIEMATRTTIVAGFGLATMSIYSAQVVPKLSRRKTIILGLFGMLISEIYLFLVLEFVREATMREVFYGVGLLSLAMAYAFGPLIICPLYTVELFTEEARWASVSLGVTIGWTLSLIMTLYIPVADYYMKSYIFFPSILGTIASIIYINKYMIETIDMPDLISISELFRRVKYRAYELQPISIGQDEYIDDGLSADPSDTDTNDTQHFEDTSNQ